MHTAFEGFCPKAISKLMGHATELITMDVYGDKANIIPEEIPELSAYMYEVMPKKDNHDNSDILEIMVDPDGFLPQQKRQNE